MEIFAERIRELRIEHGLTQEEVGKIIGVKRYAVYSYEKGRACPEMKGLVALADYFDVSLDYLCCRTDQPQGKLYECKPKVINNGQNMRKFIEMCFDPASPFNSKLKETLLQMMEDM